MKVDLSHPYSGVLRTGGYLWSPDKYELLPHSEWLAWARQAVRDDRLFLYRHREKGHFVLAAWVYRPGEWGCGVFVPLRGMRNHPDSYGGTERPNIHQLRALVSKPEAVLEGMKRTMEAERAEEAAAEDETEQSRKELVEFYKRDAKPVEAHLLRTGQTPHCSRREAGDEAFDVIEEAFK